MTYNEFHVVPELSEQGHVGGYIYYDLYFARATQHYIQNIVIPTIILTYLSFFTFLLDMRVGERLGFGMALALVVVAQQIVTSGMTPISDQKLWLDKFVSWSFYWVLVGVIQSVLVGVLFFIREDKDNRRHRPDDGNMQINEGQEIGDEKEEEELAPQTHDGQEMDDEEEIVFLSTKNDTGSKSKFRQSIRSIGKKETWKDTFVVVGCKSVLFRIPLRMMDAVALSICILTYTFFVIIMLSSGRTGTWWLLDEPNWFHEDFLDTYVQTAYVNGDPNNR